jgi:YVTN family beta-propeller protein
MNPYQPALNSFGGFRMFRISWIAAALLVSASSVSLAGSSNSLMDVAPSGKALVVANNDNDTVTLVDLQTKKVVREIKVGKKPEGVSWIGQGPLVAVTLFHEMRVVIVDTNTGKIEKTILTAAEPYGIVTDKTGKLAYVSHEYPGVVSEIDLAAGKVLRELPAGTHPRGIALAPDDKRVYVSEFYTGMLNAIDLNSAKIVDSWKGHTTDNLARHVLLHPTRPKAYLSHVRSMIKVADGAGSIFPQLSIVDLKPLPQPPLDKERQEPVRRRVSFGMDTFNGVYVTTNPWESAISPDGKRFYIIYAGTNDMNYCDVVNDDYKEVERVGNAVRVGQNPRAVRVSPDSKNVYIYNAMDFAVSIYTANMGFVTSIKTCEQPPKTPEWVRGKILFNTANQPMSQRRWVACSSCHPDGLHDGRVWQQSEGLRKTTAFVGMAHTHPIHWSADRDEVQDFEYTIRSKLMFGAGLTKGAMKQKVGFHKIELDEKMAGRSKDLDALAIYSNSLDFPLSPHIAAPGKLKPTALRGKEIFFRNEVGCATCHSGPYFTDSRLEKPFNMHDVGTGYDDKTERMGTKYDTPTLLGIYRGTPYLHDGSALTLLDVVSTKNKGDKHGKTSHLNKMELTDLVEFLKSLPYETPPDVTPNAVQYRVQPAFKKAD